MAYGYYASITVDNTKVSGSSDLTDFVVMVSGIYDSTGGEPDIRTTGNGGNVENTTTGGNSGSVTIPADLVFSPNIDGSSPYDFEIEKYDASTGEIIAWVEIPTLDYNDDTVFYMVYGDSGVTTSQEDVTGTWGSNGWVAVYHLQNVYDSTSNSYDLTNSGATFSSAKIGTGVDIDRSEGDYLYVNSSFNSTGANYTMMGWCNFTTTPANGSDWMCIFGTGKTDTYVNNIIFNNTTLVPYSFINGNFPNSGTSSASTWYFMAQEYTGSKNNLYKDNSRIINGNYSGGYAAPDFFRIGRSPYGGFPWQLDGFIDEVRYTTTALGSDWLATEYNTQSSPSTFYTMGSETAAPSAGIASRRPLVGQGA